MKNIVFVCTGNTCRSAMAQAIFNSILQKDGELKNKYSCSSAGLCSADGSPASANAVRVLKEKWNLDLHAHRSSGLTCKDIQNAWLVLVMTANHKRHIFSLYPEAADKTYTLGEFTASGSGDIDDPFGMPVNIYTRCAEQIKAELEILADKLKK